MAENTEANDKKIDDFYIQALMLSKVIKRIFERKAKLELSRKPYFVLKPITEFMKRLRVSRLDKFEEKTYISTINYYKDEKALLNHVPVGALIIYIGETYLIDLIKKMDYPEVDIDDSEALEDACGTFCNLIAGNFKSGLTQLGYVELVMSHFTGYQNEVLNGVEFPVTQKNMYEINFEVKEERWIVAELSMGSIPLVGYD